MLIALITLSFYCLGVNCINHIKLLLFITSECKNESDELCPNPYAKTGSSDSTVIAILSGLLVASLITVIVVIIVARKRKVEKFHIYSIFNDPAAIQYREPTTL